MATPKDELARLAKAKRKAADNGKGENPKLLREEATRLMGSVCPTDIELAEQNLIENGYPIQLVQQLSRI